jgi:hypothetical protein
MNFVRRFEKIKDMVLKNNLLGRCPIFLAAFLAFMLTRNAGAQGFVGDVNDLPPVTWSFNPLRYREGYVLGTIAQAANRGLFFHTLEGEFKLGVNSTKGGYVDIGCAKDQMPGADVQVNAGDLPENVMNKCLVAINPWPFSNYNQHLIADLNMVIGKPVLGFFSSYSILPLTDSRNYLSKVFVVDPDRLKVGDSYDATEDMLIAGIFHYSTGSVEGRIVEASMDGVIRKRYELIVQTGSAGDIFRQISVSDGKLFRYCLQAMSTGRYLKIDYFELLSPLAVPIDLIRGYNTYLRANKVEIIDDPTTYRSPALR